MNKPAAYLMASSVESMCRETDQTPKIEESYQRFSLVFCEQEIQGNKWLRKVEEYEVSQEVLDAMEKEQFCNRRDLVLPHQRAIDSRKNAFGLDLPIVIESTRDNTDLVANSNLRFDQIYLPTIFSCPMQLGELASNKESSLSTVRGTCQ
jgi:DNA-directed RNA polymerase subunit N (RpoN/RPB10)